MGPYVIDAYRVNHNVTCYGYAISIPREGRFDVDSAKSQECARKPGSTCRKEKPIMDGIQDVTPDMVLGATRRGLKVFYCTDTRPVPVIAEYAKEADLFICEGMYGEEGKEFESPGI